MRPVRLKLKESAKQTGGQWRPVLWDSIVTTGPAAAAAASTSSTSALTFSDPHPPATEQPAAALTVLDSLAVRVSTVQPPRGLGQDPERKQPRRKSQQKRTPPPPPPPQPSQIITQVRPGGGGTTGGSVITCMNQYVGLSADGIAAGATGFEFPADAIGHFWEIYEHTKLWRGCPVSMYAGYR